MSKYIIVCCIVFVASVTHASTPLPFRFDLLQAAKDECTRGIQSTYIELLRQNTKEATDHPTIASLQALEEVKTQVFRSFNDIIKTVQDAKSMGEVKKVELLIGIPLKCESHIITELLRAAPYFLDSNEISIIKL